MKNEYEVRGEVTAIFLRHKGVLYEAIIDTADLPKAQQHPNTWFLSAKPEINAYYVVGRFIVDNKSYYIRLHRFLMDTPAGMEVDHINHNTLDNRTSLNLRNVTTLQNQQNRSGAQTDNKTSGIRGVSFHKKSQKWRAYLKINQKSIHLGFFDDINEAKKVVTEKRKEMMPYSQDTLAN